VSDIIYVWTDPRLRGDGRCWETSHRFARGCVHTDADHSPNRHPGEGRDPATHSKTPTWMAAFAAMTEGVCVCVRSTSSTHSMAALRGGHPAQHAKMFERVTLDGRVEPGHGARGGSRKQFIRPDTGASMSSRRRPGSRQSSARRTSEVRRGRSTSTLSSMLRLAWVPACAGMTNETMAVHGAR
jgi:hypothetical protein